jgi:hypothetical protein
MHYYGAAVAYLEEGLSKITNAQLRQAGTTVVQVWNAAKYYLLHQFVPHRKHTTSLLQRQPG